ncbi:MAG TPA: LptA/OstA family protein [bacterium]|nr:LptA/OstA family protein [bacterium]
MPNGSMIRAVCGAARRWTAWRRVCLVEAVRRVTALGAAILLVASLVVPAFGAAAAPQAAPITLTADHIDYNTQTGDVVADGHVKATQADQTITSDHLTGNLQTGQVHAEGHVTLAQTGQTSTGDALTYNYRTRVGQMSNATSKYGPWNMTGHSLETARGQGVGYMTSLTPCDPKRPAFLVKSKRVVVIPDDHLTAYQSTLYVYGVPVAYLPVYTASLRRRRNAESGPTIGYTTFDGLFAEYNQFFLLGDATDQLRVRYGTNSLVTVENILSERAADHVWSLHLGRQEFYDQNGNLANVDRNSIDLVYDGHDIPGVPASYQFEAHYGDYHEKLTGVDTTRADGIVTVSSNTFQLSKVLSAAASAYYKYDYYGTGQQRNIYSVQAALSQVLNPVSSATLSYNLVSITGINPSQFVTNGGPFDPFSFDSLNNASAVTLTYSYYPIRGLFQSGSWNVAYDFNSLQTTTNMSLNFNISPSLVFTTAATYNLTQSLLTEVDYAVNGTCDCLSLGLLYRTFPSSPASNTWYITVGVNTLPGASTQFQLGGGAPSHFP